MAGRIPGSSQFDFFVIGGGSGGIASARRAAQHGARVGLADCKRLGGTCVNLGCVPKKIMWYVATVHQTLRDLTNYGFDVNEAPHFSWNLLKQNRDNYIARLNKIYSQNLKNDNISFFPFFARLMKPSKKPDGSVLHSILLSHPDDNGKQQVVTADHVLVAPGSHPKKLTIPGKDYAIDSDGFFALEEMPRKVALIGAGYIAVELAGIFGAMGAEVHLFIRGQHPLRKFDELISVEVDKGLQQHVGVIVHPESILSKIEKQAITEHRGEKLKLYLENGNAYGDFDCIIAAVGRSPSVEGLALKEAGVNVAEGSQYILVDDYQNTSSPQIYALGDVCGKLELTPVAIAAARRLADRVFGKIATAKLDYFNVPTVIFSHPPAGSIGLTEEEAKKKYGADDLQIFSASSVNLIYGPWPVAPEEKPKTYVKMICAKSQDSKVVGLHVVGLGADEMLQGFGVAIKMGARKSDFDNCVAIHPTAAEEVVTLPPWGLPYKPSNA